MIEKIGDIKRALEAKAYLFALALTLTLPDICGKAAYPFMKSRERYRKWHDENISKFDCRESCNFPVCDGVSKPCQNPDEYKSCNEITDPLYCPHYCDTDNVYVTADMCWQLHCAFLHEGRDDVNKKRKLLYDFKLQIFNSGFKSGGASAFGSSWLNDDVANKKDSICLDITQFCFGIHSAAEVFYKRNKENLDFSDAHIKLFDIDELLPRLMSGEMSVAYANGTLWTASPTGECKHKIIQGRCKRDAVDSVPYKGNVSRK